MSNYEKPVVIDEDEMFEGVFAESGDLPGGGGTPGFDVTVKWEGHNSGSHSEVNVLAHENKGCGGEYLKVTVAFSGAGDIESMSGVTNCTSWSRNGNVIEIVRQGHYNQGETFSFMIPDIRFTNSQYEGGVGSYWPSGTHMHEMAAEFSASASNC